MLIWDLTGPQSLAVSGEQAEPLEPVLTYKSEAEVTMMQWPVSHPKWICILFNNKLRMLQV